VQQAVGLHRAVVNGHFGHEEALADFDEFDAEVFAQGIGVQGVEIGKVGVLFPHKKQLAALY
jgi:hypothetical protein